MHIYDKSREILDVADGIDRLMGDRRLYARVLARFRREYAGGAAAILRFLDAGNTSEAQRLAHSLKGASGLIGALALHRQASAAEQALRLHAPRTRELTAGLEAEFDEVYRVLEVLVPVPGTDTNTDADVAPRALLADPVLLTGVAYLVVNGKREAAAAIEQSREALAALLPANAVAALCAAVGRGDFAQARQVLLDANLNG
jgi:HPt (histidine-containing phosphotransfer) domain-containing protein